MLIGMLFLDDNPETKFEHKIKHIQDYYNNKYADKFGTANCCYVNPLMLKEETIINGVTIKASKRIMRNYFWIGNSDNKRMV